MKFLRRSKPVRPATVPTDTIIPLHYWDDLQYTKALCIDVMFRFDDVMDAEKLRMSLSRLLEIGDWKKLGARLRMNDDRKLEYHIPEKYDEKRPGFIYTSAKYEISINDYPLASRLPKATDHPSVMCNVSEFESLIRHSDTPKRLEDWIYSDKPQLSIHIVLFNDATLMTVTWLHTLLDIEGLAAFLKAWVAVLHGKENEVPVFHGFSKDPLAQLSEKTPKEKYVFSGRVLKGLGLLLFVLRFLFELIWYQKVEERIIFLPGGYIERMRENAIQELTIENSGKKSFISEGDVIFGWLSRMVLSTLRPALHRTVILMNAFDIRPVLTKDIIPSNCVLVANATSIAYTFLPISWVLQKPMSFVASELRRSLEQQRTKQQVEALAALRKQTIERTGKLPIIGDSNSLLIVCSNWHKSRFFDVDFSPAVLSGVPLTERSNKPGRPSYINPICHNYPIPHRNCGIVIGKDADRNWWLSLSLRAEVWCSIEKELRVMSSVECS